MVPDTAVMPSDNFSVLRIDRTAEAGKTKGGGVCFMINKKWCVPWNISILSCSCSPHLKHLSIICRPFYLPREFSSIVITAVYIPPQGSGEGSDALVLPLWSYATGVSWWCRLGHVPGEFIWRQRIHGCEFASHWNCNYKDILQSETVGGQNRVESKSR